VTEEVLTTKRRDTGKTGGGAMLLRLAMEWMLGKFAVKMKEEEGQALAEYGLILALIAVFCIIALTLLGGNISTMLTNLANEIN
jgi:pilus assembly protein Flp/PilA